MEIAGGGEKKGDRNLGTPPYYFPVSVVFFGQSGRPGVRVRGSITLRARKVMLRIVTRFLLVTGVLQNAAQIDVSPYFTLGFSNENEGFMPFCKTPVSD